MSCGSKKRMQRQATAAHAPEIAPPIVHEVLGQTGEPLRQDTREFMESRLHFDFEKVRIHADGRAAASADAVSARAYTVGEHIVFGAGEYAPHTLGGKRLLAHELIHVIQQSQGGATADAASGLVLGPARDSAEREADFGAEQVLQGGLGGVHSSAPRWLQRATVANCEVPDRAATEIGTLAHGVIQGWFMRWCAGEGHQTCRVEEPIIGGSAKGGTGRADLFLRIDTPESPVEIGEIKPIGSKVGVYRHRAYEQLGRYIDAYNQLNADRAVPMSSWVPMPPQNGMTPFPYDDSTQYLNCSSPDKGVYRYWCTKKPKGEDWKPSTKDGELSTVKKKDEASLYTLHHGVRSATIDVPLDAKTPTGRTRYPIPEDNAMSKLVSGFSLKTLILSVGGKGMDRVEASIDPNVKIPGFLGQLGRMDSDIVFDINVVKGVRRLGQPIAAFRLYKISDERIGEGDVTLSMGKDSRLVLIGTVTPNFPLLKKTKVSFIASFTEAGLECDLVISNADILSPFAGFVVKKSTLKIKLAPDPGVSGDVKFEIGPSKRRLLEGHVSVGGSLDAMTAKGAVKSLLPGFVDVSGHVDYGDGKWRGGVEVNAEQTKLPWVKSGRVVAEFDDKGYRLSGALQMEPPGVGSLEVKAETWMTKKGETEWSLSGSGKLNVPGLDEALVSMKYDKDGLNGSVKVKTKLPGFSGEMKLAWSNQGLSGSGSLSFTHGRASGKISAEVDSSLSISGQGSLIYKFSDKLSGIATVKRSKDGQLSVVGGLKFDNVVVFDRFNGGYNFFELSKRIPIPGVSIGTFGLVAKVTGRFGAEYGIGPGVLKGVKIMSEFNPLADKKDVSLSLGGKFDVPMSAGVVLSIGGAFELNGVIASVSGGLTASGRAGVRGGMSAEAEVHYKNGTVSAGGDVSAEGLLVFGLSLDAGVAAEVLWKKYNWSWNLASYSWPTDLRLGVTVPLSYDSSKGFKKPSLNQMKWTTPRIDLDLFTKKLLSRGRRGK